MHYGCTLWWGYIPDILAGTVENSSNLSGTSSFFSLSPHPLHFYQLVWLAWWAGWCWPKNKKTNHRTCVGTCSMGSPWVSHLFSSTCHILSCPSEMKLFQLADIFICAPTLMYWRYFLWLVASLIENIARLHLHQETAMSRFHYSVSQGWVMWGLCFAVLVHITRDSSGRQFPGWSRFCHLLFQVKLTKWEHCQTSELWEQSARRRRSGPGLEPRLCHCVSSVTLDKGLLS